MHDIDYLKSNGIDVDKGIEFLGDFDTYNDILEEFYQNIGDRMGKLEDFFKKTDLKNYAIEVHALKSDSKYLGFNVLADMALEHQLKSEEGDKEYVSLHYDELISEVNRIVSIIKKYIEG